ncbi:hypothetical protein [Halomonas elongata]|uniref:hypothetical protein n=1 Tax=Halomonas elongata TaxID=2746 RepID=UPI00186BABE2|nr:hypothetical protein [Halomonas elongata]MBW5800647.1 hypothetical protein [Halomonas elongata]
MDKLPDVAALNEVDFGQQHEALFERLHKLSETVGNAAPEALPEYMHAISCINNLFANLEARIQVLEQLAIREGKYPAE